jgi:tagaturonate epimerase
MTGIPVNNLKSTRLEVYTRSLVMQEGVEYSLANTAAGVRLCALAPPELLVRSPFAGESTDLGSLTLLLCPLSSSNAASLRARLPWLQPKLLGGMTSVGMGDRMGLATPGHVRAMRSAEGKIGAIFAQQSIREMARTGRNPQQVLDDATWGIFQEGWQAGYGADADHLKTPEDIDACLAAGYTFYTIDPGAYVDNRAEHAGLPELREMVAALPNETNIHASGLANHRFDIEGLAVYFDEQTLLKSAAKYGSAVAHVAMMYDHLIQSAESRPVELEVSVDETDLPTSHADHIYIASELKRLGVRWISLAPRFVGRFEKGVDYIGDISAFEGDFVGHAAIARQFGPYKLSLHSGSDKFSIYSIAFQNSGGWVHLKTAGTSYLEALRTIAQLDPDLFREIYLFARERYETDKVSYHVSASLADAPQPEAVDCLPDLLDQFDAREILHVTFGSVLTNKTASGEWRFKERINSILLTNPDDYANNLKNHFNRHLRHFIKD